MKNSKFIMIIFFIFVSFFALIPQIKADTTGYVSASTLRIRSGASTSYSTLTYIYKGETINITDTNKITGDGCADGWYKVSYNGFNGYACASYISLGNLNLGYNISDYTARVYGNDVSIRSSANSTASRITGLMNGTNITILQTIPSGSGCSDVWYKINYHDGKTGYICGTYVIKKSDVIATNSEYEATLAAAGFPSSYWPYLVYLHNKYPNWQFLPIKTNLKWENVIDGESGKNYIQSTINAYRTSSTPREGSSWFEATDGVNAFFLDPRNFLTEKYIFMYENLKYDEATQTAEVLKSIFGTSYLSADEYVNYFLGAGQTYNVSAAHLASRVVQEGGSNSTYSAITGTSTATYNGTSLTGYYNYYNIGAYADSVTSSPVTRGLAYAAGITGGSGTSYGRPWNTREKAIYGGAQFISSGYVNAGQYTLYFQKFNTSPTATYNTYTNQYMTNIQAPSGEGSDIYYSYKDNNMIANPYAFAIPIYENMPEVTSLPTIGDVVNTLNSLSVNGVNLIDFDKDVLSYTYYVSKETTDISISAVTTSSTSLLQGIGDYNLDNENTVITIQVTSQTGESKIYTINIIKVEELQSIEDIFDNIEPSINGTSVTNIKLNTTASQLITNIKQYGPSSIITIKSPAGETLSSSSILATGQQITIKTTDNLTKTYTISVKGDSSGDGKVTILDLLQVQKDILNLKKLSGANSLAVDTSGDGKITILDLLQVQKHILGLKSL